MPSNTLQTLPQSDPGQGDRLMARKRGKQHANPEWMELLQIEREEREREQRESVSEYDALPTAEGRVSRDSSDPIDDDQEGVQNIMILENGQETPPSSGMAGYYDENDENLKNRNYLYASDSSIQGYERPGAPLYDKDGIIDTVAGSYFDKREQWQKAMEVNEPWRPQDALAKQPNNSRIMYNQGTARSSRLGGSTARQQLDTFKTMARTLPATLRKQLTIQRKKDTEAALRFQQELDDRDAYERYRMEHVKLRRIQIRENFQNRVLQRLQLEQKALTAPTVSRGQLSYQRVNHDDVNEQRFEKDAHRLWWQQARRMQQRKKLHKRQQEREEMEGYCNTMFHKTKRLEQTRRSNPKSTRRPQSPSSPTRDDHLMAEMDAFDKRMRQEEQNNIFAKLDDL
mmetsp:Transcript_1151/g.3942  ORF Transcript_1151/g.3942 Transcript_1151/m.3942 type:complete len:399 (-) Transcript_1151:5051-6247(-)